MAVAFFDLDDTLVQGDTAQTFSEYLAASSRITTPPDFLAKNHAYMAEYAEGTLDLADYMRYTLMPITSLNPAERAELIETFVSQIVAPMIPQAAHDLLNKHRRLGDKIVIVSATGIHLVKPIADYLDVPYALGVNVEEVDGRLTGEIFGVPTFREGKVTRAKHWMDEHQHSWQGSSFYSDSHNDLPLLKAVDHAYVVDPDPTLKDHAHANEWPVLSLYTNA